MKKDILPYSFFIATILFIVGAWLKIIKYNDGSIFFELGFLSIIPFFVLAVMEIIKSKNIQNHEKTMWIIGLFFMCTVIGSIYIFSARKRIIESKTQLN